MKTVFLHLLLLFMGTSFSSCEPAKTEPVSKEEALKLSAEIAAAIKDRAEYNIDQMINPEIIADKASKEMPSSFKKGFREGVESALKKNNLAKQIVKAVGKDGSYEMVKQYEIEGGQHLVFRMYSSEGLNYHDFELVKVKDKTWIADMFIYTTGENFSKSMGDVISGYLGNGTGNGDAKVKQLQKFREIRSLADRKDYKAANRLYQSMPSELKTTRMLQVVYLEIAHELGDSIYKKAVKEFEEQYKGDSTMYLSLMDPYLVNKDYERAMQCVEGVDKLINKDPLLDLYRGLIFKMMNKPEAAGAALEKLSASMPDFQEGQIELINYYAEQNLTEKRKKAIERYRANKKFNQETLDMLLALYN